VLADPHLLLCYPRAHSPSLLRARECGQPAGQSPSPPAKLDACNPPNTPSAPNPANFFLKGRFFFSTTEENETSAEISTSSPPLAPAAPSLAPPSLALEALRRRGGGFPLLEALLNPPSSGGGCSVLVMLP